MDAFGQMILDYHVGNHVLEIIEREDGFFDASDQVGFYLHEYQDWPPFEQEAMRCLFPGKVLYRLWRRPVHLPLTGTVSPRG